MEANIAELKQRLQANGGTGQTILEKATVFVEDVALRQPAKIKYKVPTVKESQQVDNGTLTEEYVNGFLEVTWTPNP